MNKATFLLVILAIGFVAAVEHFEENNAADELVRQIARMENDVRTEQREHEELWGSQAADCTQEIGFRNQEVADADAALANSQAAQAKCETALSASEADLAKANAYVQTIHENLESLRVQREQEHARFEHVLNEELNPAIEAVEGVFPLLAEFSEGPASLIQLTNHLNKSFLQMVKAQKVPQFGTILAHLLAAQSVGVSQETVEQLSKLFDDLLDDLNEERREVIATEEAQLEAYNTAVAGYNAILDSLAVTISSLEAYIVELNTCIQTEKAVSASASAKSSRNADALEHAVEMCDALQAEFDNSTASRNKELELLAKLKAFVREQEELFGNYGVDGVNAFDEYSKSFAETRAHSRANFLQLTLKKYNASEKAVAAPAKCESCRKSFLQKKLGF